MSDALRREAWRRRKEREPMDEVHREAERQYFREHRKEMARPSVPVEVMTKVEKVARSKGVSTTLYLRNILYLAVHDQLIERASHEEIIKRLSREAERQDRLTDALRGDMVAANERAKAAFDALAASEEGRLQGWLQLITLLDFVGVPEPEAEEFLAPTGNGMSGNDREVQE